MKKIAIIGANEYQARLVRAANLLNLETHVFSWSKDEVGAKIASKFYLYDVTDKMGILSKCKEVCVDGVCSVASDLTNITVDYVKKELGFRNKASKTIELTTNKNLMRKRLLDRGNPVPRFFLAKNAAQIPEYLLFPLIVKPIDRSGSRGITKVNNKSSLYKAIDIAKSISFSDAILIEEFIDGQEFSVESFSIDGKHHILQITEKFTSGAPHFIEKAHLAPARVSKNLKSKIYSVIDKALTDLEITNGSSHSEIKINSSGVMKIIEIGSRMGGDFIGSDLVFNSTGIDYLNLEIVSALREEINYEYLKQNKDVNVISFFFFDKNDIKKFEKVREFVEVIDYVILHDPFDSILESADRFGYAIFIVPNNCLNFIINELRV